jgi:hypothetical protein
VEAPSSLKDMAAQVVASTSNTGAEPLGSLSSGAQELGFKQDSVMETAAKREFNCAVRLG